MTSPTRAGHIRPHADLRQPVSLEYNRQARTLHLLRFNDSDRNHRWRCPRLLLADQAQARRTSGHETVLTGGILMDERSYFARTSNAANGSATVYPVASTTKYRNTDGTGAETTNFDYTYFAGTAKIESVTTKKPLVDATQNGPGTVAILLPLFTTSTPNPSGKKTLTGLSITPNSTSILGRSRSKSAT